MNSEEQIKEIELQIKAKGFASEDDLNALKEHKLKTSSMGYAWKQLFSNVRQLGSAVFNKK